MRPQWVAAAGVLTLGCATVDMERIAMPDDAPPLVLGLIVVGPEHTIDKADRCRAVGGRLGVRVVPHEREAVAVQLHLEDGKNQLTVLSKARGVVLREPREGWSMEELCVDAFRRGAMQLIAESRAHRVRAVAEVTLSPVPALASPPQAAAASPQAAEQEETAEAAESAEPAPVPNEPMTSRIEPVTPPPKRASGQRLLSVNTEPPGANLWVDGSPRGTAPLSTEQVGAGDHVVEALWPDGRWMVAGARLRRGSARTITLRVIH